VRVRPLLLIGVFLVFTLLFSSPASSGDIYRWVDSEGGVHYTDDSQNIPPRYRDHAKKGGLPPISTYHEEDTSSPFPEGENGVAGQEEMGNGENSEKSAEQVDLAIATLENKIKAKVDLIEYVDGKRNLAINPLRNRVISEKDQSLYKKYKKELPEDKRRLEELYSLKKQLEER